jgi:hypothetical protein
MNIATLAERLQDADATVRRLAVIELPYSDEDDIVPLLLPRLNGPRRAGEAVRAGRPGGARGGAGLATMLLDPMPACARPPAVLGELSTSAARCWRCWGRGARRARALLSARCALPRRAPSPAMHRCDRMPPCGVRPSACSAT